MTPDIIFFKPNIRWEPATAATGYTWGKPASESNILKGLPDGFPEENLKEAPLAIPPDATVAERWLCTDDRGFASESYFAHTPEEPHPFWQLLESNPTAILGELHAQQYGPYLGCIMKLLDTNSQPNKGSLSVQVHPKPGHPTRPSKPEMWKPMPMRNSQPNLSSVYLGWKSNATPDILRQAVANSTLEQHLNLIELNPETLVLVAGGLIHAIRANSFLAEWSKAPGADDIKKGNVKDATVAPYDRTDGKTPRPGKEDVENTIEIMERADTFKSSDPFELIAKSQELSKDSFGNLHEALFRTEDVSVDQHTVVTEVKIDVSQRGLPLFIESGGGSVSYTYNGQPATQKLTAGMELYIPAALTEITITTAQDTPLVFQTWWKP